MLAEIINQISPPTPLHLDVSELHKGINNYHHDVQLSTQFRQDVEQLIKELILEEASFKTNSREHKNSFLKVQNSYLDMMTVLIHRIKTDLNMDEILFLQFSIPKYILTNVEETLDVYIKNIREKSNVSRNFGSPNILDLHEHLAWLRKNFNAIYYNVVKQVFKQLHRVETKDLASIRRQYIATDTSYIEILYSPMLMTKELNHSIFLIEHHLFLNNHEDINQFKEFNLEIERLFENLLVDNGDITLNYNRGDEHELYTSLDNLGVLGDFSLIKDFLDPMIEPGKVCHETLSWMESPDNIKVIFNYKNRYRLESLTHQETGINAWMKSFVQVNKSKKLLKKITNSLKDKNLLPQFMASYETRLIWNKHFSEKLPQKKLCQYLAGIISLEQMLDSVFKEQELSDDDINIFILSAKKINTELMKNLDGITIRILSDLAYFRLQLKQFRFTHQIFNQINLLRKKEEIELSRKSRTLYRLPVVGEDEEDEEEKNVLHHSILKVSIRGATKVTAELERAGLNPAAYFSLRLFDPINKVLDSYSAKKTFVDGSSLTFSFLEYENAPQRWFSVAYACGLAQSILEIVKENSYHSRELDLPTLELDFGISFSNTKPYFLYDDNQEIMISSAIAQAEQLTAINNALDPHNISDHYNAPHSSTQENTSRQASPEQSSIKTMNNILLQNSAFEKLENEVDLKIIKVNIDNLPLDFYYGEYQDVFGKKKDLIIKPGNPDPFNHTTGSETKQSQPYFEVISDSRIIGIVRDMFNDSLSSSLSQIPNSPSLTRNSSPFIY